MGSCQPWLQSKAEFNYGQAEPSCQAPRPVWMVLTQPQHR